MSDQVPVELPLSGCTLSRFVVDGEAYLGFTRTEPELWTAELRMGGPIQVVRDGVESRLSAEKPDSLGPLLTMIGRRVVTARVSASGVFEVVLDDGCAVSVPAMEEFESWQYSDGDKRHLVCLAGGHVARW